MQLDDRFLASVGLETMPADEKKAFLQYIYEELELRVGKELSKDLSDEQLDQFEALAAAGDPVAVTGWLRAHCPNYKEVVGRELASLKEEIIASKDRLLGGAST